MKRFSWKGFQVALLTVVAVFSLSACGGDGQPFIMEVDSTLFVGDSSSGGSLVDPVQQNVEGNLQAQVLREFSDHFELEILSFELTADFPDVGLIQFVLDPSVPSLMSVSKLNRNNNPFGPNVMSLSLIVQMPDQDLNLSNLIFSSDSAILPLSESLPALGFTANGQSFAIQVAAMQVLIPSELIVSDFDPQ